MLIAQRFEFAARQLQGFIPSGFSENFAPSAIFKGRARQNSFGHTRFANQGLCKPPFVMHVIKAKAPFHTQPRIVRWPCAAFHAHDFVVPHVVGDQAPHAAIRADRINLLIYLLRAHQRLGHQRPRRTGLHTFAACHATALAHAVALIKYDFCVTATQGHANHIVDLHLTAGPHTSRALDAGIEIHRHRGVRKIIGRLLEA